MIACQAVRIPLNITIALLMFGFLINSLSAQDCHNPHDKLAAAFVLQSKKSLHFEPICRSTEAEIIPTETCMIQTDTRFWLRWQIAREGDFYFKIIPKDSTFDFDFAVFQISGIGEQQELILIRCMTSGSSGWPSNFDDTPCLGETGLSPSEKDTMEYPGCDTRSNNFLSALTCRKGDRYALLINDFSQSGQGFAMEFCGSAVLSPSDEPCSDFSTSTQQHLASGLLNITPNPSSKEIIHVTLPEKKNAPVQMILNHSTGLVIKMENLHATEGIVEIDLSDIALISGLYFVTLKTDHQYFNSKLVLID